MNNIWYPFYQAQVDGPPIKVSRASGVFLHDDQGKSYLDINSSWWVNVHGHGREEIRNAISEQFNQIDHIIFSGVTHDAAEKVAAQVVGLLGNAYSKVFFSDDGSTAVEVALKMAIQFFSNRNIPRKKIVAFDGAYHGDTFGAMSAGQRGYFNKPFEPYFFDVEFLPFPSEEHWEACLALAQKLAAQNDVVAFIAEPLVQGSAGMRMYNSAYLDVLTRTFRAAGSLVIFDEIMTGWGRLGTYFAMNQCQEKPDIVCLSKGLTGGVLPLGLTIATQEIFDVFDQPDKSKALLHGHSFTGNPLSCAAALASMALFQQEETWRNIERVSRKMASFVTRLQAAGLYHNARSSGTIFAVDLLPSDGYFAAIRNQIYQHFIDHGILCRPLGATVFFNPPYIITDEQLEQAFEVLLAFAPLIDREK
jgi:adenosylmethionine---8-amino-7-oxononanoate aminotransferase